jgi:cytochrome P450
MLHFNPEYFPNPFKFDPDRWLDESRNLSINEPFSFIPFR